MVGNNGCGALLDYFNFIGIIGISNIEIEVKMKEKIDTDKMEAASFLMVLTGTGDYAYCRQDGVLVVPIGCLKN